MRTTIKGKIGDNLRAALDRLPLNRELVTIKIDVPLDGNAQSLGLRERDVEALRRLYQRYGFNQALKELEGGSAATSRSAPRRNLVARAVAGFRASPRRQTPWRWIRRCPCRANTKPCSRKEQLDAWIGVLRKADEFAFDTETDSLDPMQANLVGLSFAVEPSKAVYIPLAHDYPGAPAQLDRAATLAALAPLFADADKKKLGQHGKYDLHVLRRHGVEVAGYADDTMLESFVLNSGSSRHDMDCLAKRYLGYDTIKYEARRRQGRQADPVLAGRAGRRHALCGRGRRRHPAPAPRAVVEAGGGTRLAKRVPRHRDAAGAGAGTHRGQWRAHRWR